MEVYVTGGTGLVGTAFYNHKDPSINYTVIPGPSAGGPDFSIREETLDFFSNKKIDALVHTAARVGGIKANIDNPLDFYSQNTRINTNVLDAAATNNIKKCVSFLSTCVYPNKSEYPLMEKNIHTGEPHESNFSYAYSKRMLDIHSRAINKQLGYQYFCVSPNNLYGINDNFDTDDSHVIPGIMIKIQNAKLQKKDTVNLWGDGSPLREFTFASDIPDLISFLLNKNNVAGVINIGNTTSEISIKELAKKIKNAFNYQLNLSWDLEKPNGQFRKPSSSKKLEELGYDLSMFTNINHGITKTTSWFLENYPNIRGVR